MVERNHFIDVLKGICIIFVIITHYSWTESELLCFLFPFLIEMAVPIFMIISGYLYAKSYEKNSIQTIEEAYSLRNILNKVVRYTVPFLGVFILEELLCAITGLHDVSLLQFIRYFLRGGMGPGSYYYPVMIQLIFIFPIIYVIIQKYDGKGLFLCGILNLLYEMLQNSYGMNEECYRLLVFRYILVISFGCYLASPRYKSNVLMSVIAEVVGIVFICLYYYWGYKPRVIIYWTGTSFLASLFIIPISIILLKKITWRCKPLEIIGKASFNIFLVQMVYYNGAEIIYRSIENRTLQLIINIFLCVFLGILFYYIETPITKKINKKLYSLFNIN